LDSYNNNYYNTYHSYNYNITTTTTTTATTATTTATLHYNTTTYNYDCNYNYIALHYTSYTTLHPAVEVEVTTATTPKSTTPTSFQSINGFTCHPCITTTHHL
jgi:hypothetical protein